VSPRHSAETWLATKIRLKRYRDVAPDVFTLIISHCKFLILDFGAHPAPSASMFFALRRS
jgi:hypothetical protein